MPNLKARRWCSFEVWALALLSCLFLVAINLNTLFAYPSSHSLSRLRELAPLYPFCFQSNIIINYAVFGASQFETSVFTDQVQFDKYSLILRGQRVFLQ